MYTEFKLIYVGLGIIAALLTAVIVLLVILLKKSGSGRIRRDGIHSDLPNYTSTNYAAPKQTVSGIVFCPSCGAQFDSKHLVCPKCGKPR